MALLCGPDLDEGDDHVFIGVVAPKSYLVGRVVVVVFVVVSIF